MFIIRRISHNIICSTNPGGINLLSTQAELQAAATLEVALQLGDPGLIDLATADLLTTVAQEALVAPSAATGAGASSGIVDRRGRIRMEGTCENGGEAQAPGLRCSTSGSGDYRCQGRGLVSGQQIQAVCVGGTEAAGTSSETVSEAPVGVVTAAVLVDSRGSVRVNGTCDSGSAVSANLSCTTHRSGSFRCRGRGLTPEDVVVVSCL